MAVVVIGETLTWYSTVDSVPSGMTSKKHSLAESGSSNVSSTAFVNPNSIGSTIKFLIFQVFWLCLNAVKNMSALTAFEFWFVGTLVDAQLCSGMENAD